MEDFHSAPESALGAGGRAFKSPRPDQPIQRDAGFPRTGQILLPSLGPSDGRQAATTEPSVPVRPKSKSDESLSPQRKPGAVVEVTYEGAMLRYLRSWTLQLRWQRLPAFGKLAHMLIDHLDGILNYCRIKVRFGVVEAINGNVQTLLRRGRGYKNLRYLLF